MKRTKPTEKKKTKEQSTTRAQRLANDRATQIDPRRRPSYNTRDAYKRAPLSRMGLGSQTRARAPTMCFVYNLVSGFRGNIAGIIYDPSRARFVYSARASSSPKVKSLSHLAPGAITPRRRASVQELFEERQKFYEEPDVSRSGCSWRMISYWVFSPACNSF